MKTKSKFLLALLTATLALGTATVTVAADTPTSAQAVPTPEELARLEADIGLTAEQTAKVAALLEEMKDKRGAIKRDASLDRDQQKARSKASDEEIRTRIRATMTAEQFVKWDKLQAARRLAR